MQKIQSIHNCENCKLKYKNVNFGNQSFVQTITNVSWWPFNDAVKNANYANNMIHIPIASFVIMKASCLERVSTEERVSKADHGKTIESDGKILLNGLICRSMMLQLVPSRTPAEHSLACHQDDSKCARKMETALMQGNKKTKGYSS